MLIGSFANNRVTANGGLAGFVYAATAGFLEPNSTYTGNANDWVVISNNGDHADVRSEQTWAALDVPYVVEASSDLRDWTAVGTVQSPEGLLNFTEAVNATAGQRFYRLRQQ